MNAGIRHPSDGRCRGDYVGTCRYPPSGLGSGDGVADARGSTPLPPDSVAAAPLAPPIDRQISVCRDSAYRQERRQEGWAPLPVLQTALGLPERQDGEVPPDILSHRTPMFPRKTWAILRPSPSAEPPARIQSPAYLSKDAGLRAGWPGRSPWTGNGARVRPVSRVKEDYRWNRVRVPVRGGCPRLMLA